MNIVILDGYTIHPGDLSWKPIEALGELDAYDRTAPEDTFARSREAEVVITSKVVFDRGLIFKLEKLKYIGVIATGYNVIDCEAARERGITVTNVPDYCSESVAQMVLAHILELARRLGHHDRTVKEGRWTDNEDFCYWDYAQVELTGKTLGLVGCGNIGRKVASIARAFDMQVIAYDLYPSAPEELQIEFTDLDTVFRESDIVSLHCPLTAETEGLINRASLAAMKPTAFLVNTSRGPLVKDEELAEALNEGVIAGAGLDVLSVEPPPAGNPLFSAKNCHLSPHLAWASKEARERLIQLTADNIKAWMDGEPINVVN